VIELNERLTVKLQIALNKKMRDEGKISNATFEKAHAQLIAKLLH
jgi:hypothetical protein